MRYSEALLLIEEMLKASREVAGVKDSYAFDSGVLMSALANAMLDNKKLAAEMQRRYGDSK